MRGLHPRTPVLFSSCWNTTLCSAGKGKHRAALFPSCCWSGSAAALVSPLTPFPGISAVVLNLLLVYQPQTAQGGIFFSPPQRGKAKKSSSRAGHNPAPRPACKAYSVSGSMSAGRSVLSNSITHTSGFAFQPSVRTLAAGSVLSHSLRNEVM